MRVTVPPRNIAAQIKLHAAVRGGWACAGVALALQTVFTVTAVLQLAPASALWFPLLPVMGMGAVLAMMALMPRRLAGFIYLVLGCAAMVAYAGHMNTILGGLRPDELYLLSPLVTALAVVGNVTGRELGGLVWTLVGTVLGQGTLVAIQLAFAQPLRFDPVAGIISALFLALYLMLWSSDRAQRHLLADGAAHDDHEARASQLSHETWQAAMVHETVLGDLALVTHGASEVSDTDRARLLRTVSTVSTAAPVDEQRSSAGRLSDFYGIISDFQWRGLSIDVGGDSVVIDGLAVAARLALLGALRSALDNVLAHSGRNSAEVFIDADSDSLTVMIVDDGVGFDVAKVGDDRFGVRMSIMRRVENCGGSAAIWSSLDAGTSVVLTLPILQRRADIIPQT